MQLESQNYSCSWCYNTHAIILQVPFLQQHIAVCLILLSNFFNLSPTLSLVWLHIPERIQPCQVCFMAPALAYPIQRCQHTGAKRSSCRSLHFGSFYTHFCGPATLILVSLSGVSPCTETINTEHLKSDRDWKQRVSGCHLVRGGERRGRMDELDLFLFHPAHISGSMTEMDEGAAEVSLQCNDVAAING